MDNIACQDSDGFFADDSRSSLVGMIRRHHVVPRTNLLRVLHISISFGRCCLRCFFFVPFSYLRFSFPSVVRRSSKATATAHNDRIAPLITSFTGPYATAIDPAPLITTHQPQTTTATTKTATATTTPVCSCRNANEIPLFPITCNCGSLPAS